MLNALVQVTAGFDWISPLISLLQDIRHGPSERLAVKVIPGWSPNDVLRYVRRHGIRVWGPMLMGDTIMFKVPRTQARLARSLFRES
ncbi:MAG: hypothetical protein Kow0047_06510 [Anaerolineae bacterium]